VCGTILTAPFADLGMTPVANDLVRPDRLHLGERYYPLVAKVCDACWLVQLDAPLPAGDIFTDQYPYFSSFSSSWLKHAEHYAATIRDRLRLDDRAFVVEIASNDGYLLQYFKKHGIRVLGVDPSANVAAAAVSQRGIPTVTEFFGREVGARLRREHGPADLMIANNVLAHVPDPVDFLSGFAELLADEGIVTVEFPHLLSLLRHGEFDTIYHEHVFYLSISGLMRALSLAGLRPFDVEELPTHGGSLRVYVCRETSQIRTTAELSAMIDKEEAAGLGRVSTYVDFNKRVQEKKRDILSFLIARKKEGKTIAAYGAPAKGNTLLNFCGIGRDMLDYTVDLNPHKQGKYLPGTRLEIFPPAKIQETKPDLVLILPWNIADEIMSSMASIRSWGGQFIIPIPDIRLC
jgi:SAM-dependent methyltransferase